jgi:hypothetical protein
MRRVRGPVRVLLLCAVLTTVSFAAPPADVGPSLRIANDRETLTWDAVPNAERYNVYRGESRLLDDLRCLVYRTAETTAIDPDVPEPLFTYVVGAWNSDGESSIGEATDGTPREAAVRCADDDEDGVRDDWDNCPGRLNPEQLDQDESGTGDLCDPATYHFEDDEPGTRPEGMTQIGADNPTFAVRETDGELGVSYDGGLGGVADRFDRVSAQGARQEYDVWLDPEPSSSDELAIEMWSDGTVAEEAGNALRVRLVDGNRITAALRTGTSTDSLGDATLSDPSRLRLRLRRTGVSSSELNVDTLSGGGWFEEVSFPIEDDSRLYGRDLVVVNSGGGRRVARRVTARARPSNEPIEVLRSFATVTDWKIFQRGPEGLAPIPVRVSYTTDEPARVELAIVDEGGEGALPGLSFADLRFDVQPAPEGAVLETTIADVPEGGKYELRARLVKVSNDAILGTDAVLALGVGDVFLAAGQSNMCGFSGTLGFPEPPSRDVHLFGNDYVWQQAEEPMDGLTNQVDEVSADPNSRHSPMLSFGKVVAEAIGVPVGIVPAPMNNTNLYRDWARNADDPTNRGTLYGSSLHRILAQAYAHPIRGVIWWQGESDQGRGTTRYRDDLDRLVADYRSDLGNPELFFGNIQLTTYQNSVIGAWLAIQEAQRAQAADDPLSVAVSSIDIERRDSVHFDAEGYKRVGRRLARGVLDELYGIPRDFGPKLVEVRFADAGRTAVEIVYDRDVEGGGDSALFLVQDPAEVPITAASSSGNVVTLSLGRAAESPADVSYGYLKESSEWIVAADGGGGALAFQFLPLP